MKNIRIFSAVVLISLFGCSHENGEENRAYYRSQVDKRIEAVMTDTSYRELPAIHEEFERIILVSKDNENPMAAVNLASTLFDSLCQTYGLQRTDFSDIEPGMSLAEIEMRLRENELAFFDRLAMKVNPEAADLFTAH